MLTLFYFFVCPLRGGVRGQSFGPSKYLIFFIDALPKLQLKYGGFNPGYILKKCKVDIFINFFFLNIFI